MPPEPPVTGQRPNAICCPRCGKNTGHYDLRAQLETALRPQQGDPTRVVGADGQPNFQPGLLGRQGEAGAKPKFRQSEPHRAVQDEDWEAMVEAYEVEMCSTWVEANLRDENSDECPWMEAWFASRDFYAARGASDG